MMRSLFLVVFFLSAFCTYAQEWYDLMQDPKAKFSEVQNAFYRYAAQRNKEPQEVKGYKQFKRWEWFWKQRLDQNGNIPDGPALQARWQSFARSFSSSRTAKMMEEGWKPLGPFTSFSGYGGIGRMNCIAFHPTDPNTYYLGSASGGVWKTTDGGKTYKPLTDNIRSMTIRSIEVHPQNPNIVVFAAFGYPALYRSEDGGATWAALEGPFGPFSSIYSVSFNPQNGNDLLVSAMSYGIFRSLDGGKTFKNTGPEMEGVTRNPSQPNIVYAVKKLTHPKRAFMVSTDGGNTWVQKYTFSELYHFRMAVTPANPNVVEIISSHSDGVSLGAIYKSTDRGVSFNKYFTATASTNYFGYDRNGAGWGGQAWYCMFYAIDPTNENIKYLGGINTWKTTDGGKTWKLVNHWCCPPSGVQTVHADKHFLAFSPAVPGRIYECNDGGLYYSDDGGKSWIDKSNGLVTTQIYRISTPNRGASKMHYILGSQDNGTKQLQANSAWKDIFGGDGMDNDIDPLNADIFYVSIQSGNIYRTTDFGLNYTHISANLPGGQIPGPWVTPFEIDRTNPQTLYAGYKDIYKTSNRGNSWVKLTNNLFGGREVSKIRIAPSDGRVIYAFEYSQLMKSVDGGTSWKNVALPVGGWGIRDVAIHPHNPNRIWLTYPTSDSKQVWVSDNGGQSWKDMSLNLPAVGYGSIAIAAFEADQEDVYLASDYGIVYKGASANGWVSYSKDLPSVAINEIMIDSYNMSLIAGTWGRGLWMVPLASRVRGGMVTITDKTVFKPEDTMRVKFDFFAGSRNTGNTFTVELVNESLPSFTPVSLKTVTGTAATDSLQVVLPSSLACGEQYRVRVISSSPGDTTMPSTAFSIKYNPIARILNGTQENGFCPNEGLLIKSYSGRDYKYQWYFNNIIIENATDSHYLAKVAGSYRVWVTLPGCGEAWSSSFNVVSIAKPISVISNITGTKSFCHEDSVKLVAQNGTGYNFRWYKDGLLFKTTTVNELFVKEPGVWKVEAFIPNSCSGDLSSPVTLEKVTVSTPVVTANGATAFCEGGSVTLASSAPANNQWFKDGQAINGAKGTSYVVKVSGEYTVRVTSSGCTSAMSSAIEVTVTSLPATPSITTSGAPDICEGESIQLTSSAAAGNQWYKNGVAIGGATSQNYSTNQEGSYTVKNTLNGCTSAASIATVVTVHANPPKPTITASGNTLTSSAATGNQWYLNGALIPGATSQQYTVQASGQYTVQVTLNGCSATSEVYNFVATGMVDVTMWNGEVTAYPNPVRDQLFITNKAGRKLEAQLVDAQGRQVYKTQFSTTSSSLSLKGLAHGTYLLLITDLKRKETISKTIVIQ